MAALMILLVIGMPLFGWFLSTYIICTLSSLSLLSEISLLSCLSNYYLAESLVFEKALSLLMPDFSINSVMCWPRISSEETFLQDQPSFVVHRVANLL